MTVPHTKTSNRTYMGTWAALLFLTVGMLATGYITLTKAGLIAILCLAMIAKASLIGAYFMHLRFERKGLILTVALGLLATAAIMFGILALDSRSILEHLAH